MKYYELTKYIILITITYLLIGKWLYYHKYSYFGYKTLTLGDCLYKDKGLLYTHCKLPLKIAIKFLFTIFLFCSLFLVLYFIALQSLYACISFTTGYQHKLLNCHKITLS